MVAAAEVYRDAQAKERYRKLAAQLELARTSWEPTWRDIANWLLTDRSRFLGQIANDGMRLNSKIIDATAAKALDTLAAGMMSGLTSPAREWFLLRTDDPDLNDYQPVKDYLADTGLRLRDLLIGSNVYNALPICYGDLGGFGMNATLLAEDDADVIRAYSWPVGQYAFAANERGLVDTVVRRFSMTAAQLVGRFGLDACSQMVKSAYEDDKASVWFDVEHVITPNRDYDPAKLSRRRKRFTSCYYEVSGEGEQFLSMGGYDDFPVLCPRWQVRGEDAYGRSYPGIQMIGDVKMLQKLHEKKLKALDKMVDPPMNASMSMRGHRLSVLPGDVNYLPDRANGEGFKPAYQVAFPVNDVRQEINEVQRRIDRAAYADLFLMLANGEQGDMTAREIEERHEEKLLALGPVVERLDDELYGPLIDRAFNLAAKRGLLPKAPPEIQGRKLKIEYQSIMRQAMRAVGVGALDRFVQTVGQMAQVNPEVLDNVDSDAVVDTYGDLLGMPSKVIRSAEDVAARRKSRQQQQAAQQAAALANSASATAKNLSAADTSTDNGLTRALGLPAAAEAAQP